MLLGADYDSLASDYRFSPAKLLIPSAASLRRGRRLAGLHSAWESWQPGFVNRTGSQLLRIPPLLNAIAYRRTYQAGKRNPTGTDSDRLQIDGLRLWLVLRWSTPRPNCNGSGA